MSRKKTRPYGKPDRAIGCPACDRTIALRPRVEIKGVEQFDRSTHFMPDDIRKGERFRSSTFRCPCCKERFQLLVQVVVHKIIPIPSNRHTAPRQSGLMKEEIEFLGRVEESGLLRVFQGVIAKVNEGPRGRNPRDIRTFFINFLRSAKPVNAAEAARRMLSREHRRSFEIWQAQGVAMIVINEQIVQFLPWSLLKHSDLMQGGSRRIQGGRLPQRSDELQELMRTKYGFVPPGARHFLYEIRGNVQPHKNGNRDHELIGSKRSSGRRGAPGQKRSNRRW